MTDKKVMDRAIELFLLGKTPEEIKKDCGVPKSTLYANARKRGIERPELAKEAEPEKKQKDPKYKMKIKLDEFKKLIDEGMDVHMLANHFNATEDSIYRAARKHGLKIKRKKRVPSQKKEHGQFESGETTKKALGLQPKSSPVNCTACVLKKCYYGGYDGCCNFALIEKRSRMSTGSPHAACIQFITHKNAKKLLEEKKNGRN